MKKLFISTLFLFVLFGCSTQKEYYLKANDFIGKTIVFTLQEGTSYQKVNKTGEHAGNSKDPNIHEVFRKGIEQLAKETKINLVYSSSYVFPSDSVIPVMVSIKRIVWVFDESKTTMYAHMEYTLKDKTFNITGIHKYKIFVAGTKTGNLRKTLKDGNKQLLATF